MAASFFLQAAQDIGQAHMSRRHVNQPPEIFPVRRIFTESVLGVSTLEK